MSKIKRSPHSLVPPFVFAYAIAAVLIVTAVYYANVWNFMANTRILALLIDGGVVKHHDAQLGFVEGVEKVIHYLKSQEPIDWALIPLVFCVFWFFYLVKGLQFHVLCKFYGLPGGVVANARAWYRGTLYSFWLPFKAGDVASTLTLRANGSPSKKAALVVRLMDVFILFEVVVYATIGLLLSGWSTWFAQLFWPLAIVTIAFLWVRQTGQETVSLGNLARIGLRDLSQSPKTLLALGLLSLVAFGIQDVAAYTAAMSFSGEYVRLHAEFGLIVMAIVGGYIARLVPVTPGGIGQFEWGCATAIYFGGVGFPEAVTIAVLFTFFRYLSYGIFYLVTTLRANSPTEPETVLRTFKSLASEETPEALLEEATA